MVDKKIAIRQSNLGTSDLPGNTGLFNIGHRMSLPKKIGIIYTDAKREYYLTEEQYKTDTFDYENVILIQKYLLKMGVSNVILYPGNSSLPMALKENKPDMVINLVDTVRGSGSLSSTIPSILDLLEIPYTGTGVFGFILTSNRFLSAQTMQQNGIPVPDFQLFLSPTDPIDPLLKYPLISKLNEEHGSIEIHNDSVSENEKHLRERLKFLIRTYKQPVFVSEYIAGKEIAAFAIDGLNVKTYFGEKIFTKTDQKYVIQTFEDKWVTLDHSTYHYRKYEDSLLKDYVKKAFEVLKMSDYAKFDVRIDDAGRYYFLDANANPFFGPKESDTTIGIVLDMYGISFYEILKRIVFNTIKEFNIAV